MRAYDVSADEAVGGHVVGGVVGPPLRQRGIAGVLRVEQPVEVVVGVGPAVGIAGDGGVARRVDAPGGASRKRDVLQDARALRRDDAHQPAAGVRAGCSVGIWRRKKSVGVRRGDAVGVDRLHHLTAGVIRERRDVPGDRFEPAGVVVFPLVRCRADCARGGQLTAGSRLAPT